jgi:hypothetical protein
LAYLGRFVIFADHFHLSSLWCSVFVNDVVFF